MKPMSDLIERLRISHAQLVREAANWLRNSRRCSVVAIEIVTALSETPDAIGWGYQGQSIMVECKTSRADFFADGNKHHRNGAGLGQERWFYIPEGLVSPGEVPAGWGLIERQTYGGRHICRQTVKAELRQLAPDVSLRERRILISVAFRALEAVSLVKPLSISDQEPEK